MEYVVKKISVTMEVIANENGVKQWTMKCVVLKPANYVYYGIKQGDLQIYDNILIKKCKLFLHRFAPFFAESAHRLFFNNPKFISNQILAEMLQCKEFEENCEINSQFINVIITPCNTKKKCRKMKWIMKVDLK